MATPAHAMTGGRVHALDGLRGIAALAVALSHYHELHALLLPTGHVRIDSMFTSSYLFVDFFFVLSGFVLARASQDHLTTPRGRAAFAMRRIGRLWPLHMAMLLVIALIFAAYAALTGSSELPVPTVTMDAPSAVASAFLVQGLGFQSGLIWNWPAWSIACELWVNLLMVLLVAIAPRRFIAISALLVVLSASALLLGGDDNMFRVQALAFARCMYGYFLGVLLVFAMKHMRALNLGAQRDVTFWRPLEVATLALPLTFMFVSADNKASFAAPLVFVPVILVFAQSPGPVAARLGSGAFHAVGQWSYSIYLVHAPLLILALTVTDLTARFAPDLAKAVAAIAANPWAQDAALLIFAGTVVALSRLTYTRIEEPARRAVNRLVATTLDRERPLPPGYQTPPTPNAPRLA